MNIHTVHLPVLQSLASQIRMCAPPALCFPVLLLGTRSLEIEGLGTALEVLKGLKCWKWMYVRTIPSLIFGMRGRTAGHKHGRLTRVSQICWPNDDLESAGPYLSLAQTSVFSKNNTEIKYKLNYSGTMMVFFGFNAKKLGLCYQCQTEIKYLNNARFAKLCLKLC